MEFRTSKENILKGLSKIQSIVELRNTMPILSNTLIKTDKDGLIFLATDLEVSFSGKISAQIKEEGAITVSAKKLYEILKEFPDKDIDFKKDDNNWLIINCDKINFKVVGLPADEFPSLPEDSSEKEFCNVNKELLKEMIDKTSFAISTEESRVNLNGVYLEKQTPESGGGINMVATDGHRLSMINKDIDLGVDTPILIPRKGIAEIKKVLEDCDDDSIQFKVIKNNCLIRTAGSTLFIRLIDETFPNYRQVVPKENDKKITVSKSVLLKSLRRISLLSTEKYKGIKLQVENGAMTLTSNNYEYGEAQETLDVKCNFQDGVTIGLNAKYMMDVLNISTTETVDIELKDDVTQSIIKQTDDNSFISVIMPMRL